MKLIFTLGLFIVFNTHALAASRSYQNVVDLITLPEQVNKDRVEKKSTLILFDIDDTLLEARNFVGSGKWYAWQRGRPVNDKNGKPFKIQQENKFACIFRVLGTTFEISSAKLTQENAAEIVSSLNDYDVMILTSRTAKYRVSTERELAHNGISLSANHLTKSTGNLDFDFFDGKRTAKVTYANGIVMSSGLNKGLVLESVLDKLNKKYKNIYFVDDSEKNINNMQKAWKDSNTNLNTFHYTLVDKTISKNEIEQSILAKKQFDGFIKAAYPDRFEEFKNGQCE